MIIFLLISLVVLYVYSPWLAIEKTLSSGDFPYLFWENIKEFSFLPSSGSLWLTSYYQITAKLFVQYLGLSWNFAEKILWFWPFILLSISSSYYLTKSWLGVLIYTTNTYVLMLVGGGQMGVALAYSLAPLILGVFIKLIQNSELRIQNLVLAGLILGLELMFDPRIVYISMIAVILYFLFNFKPQILRRTFFIILIPVGIAVFLNSYWIISLIQTGFPAEVRNYGSLAGFQFLSFADFSHVFSLLHPNWPENIFGKVYFLQPEFLLLPIIAFSSLLFINSKLQLKSQILYFSLLGLMGAFLAKGSNPPSGEVNEFLFQNFPGMSMFRDASKFYILVILSYSVLVPFTLQKLSEKVSGIKYIIFAVFLIFWLFSIRPAISGQLEGTFKPVVMPQGYIQLKDFLQNQPQSFQTFWIPGIERFGFRSNAHPAISAEVYFQTNDFAEILGEFKKKELEKQFLDLSIKYVIVPHDVKKELFFTDRKYDESRYEEAKITLKTVPWLKPIGDFEKIAVFELKAKE